jgi:hypothetical protein
MRGEMKMKNSAYPTIFITRNCWHTTRLQHGRAPGLARCLALVFRGQIDHPTSLCAVQNLRKWHGPAVSVSWSEDESIEGDKTLVRA